MPIDYKQYPPNWKTEIRPDILKRDGYKCKKCLVPNYAVGYRSPSGTFVSVDERERERQEQRGRHIIKIVLTVAHLDHNRDNNHPGNLAALCQKCHLSYDAAQHQSNAAETRRKKKI